MLSSIAIKATTLEPGMVAGEGLTAIQTALYFFVTPVALFVVISLLSYASSSKKSKKKAPIDQID